MKRTHCITENGRETCEGTAFCRTHGIVPLYYFDGISSKVKCAGHSEMIYDFIIEGDGQEFGFPDGEKTPGYRVIYRWSTNPFTCIVKSKDVTLCE